MTDNQIQEEESSKGRGAEVLFYAGTVLLFFVFRFWFSLSGPFSIFLAIGIELLVAYPLFIRGKSNDWRKDKGHWTFLTWLIPTFVIASGFYVAYWILEPFYPW